MKSSWETGCPISVWTPDGDSLFPYWRLHLRPRYLAQALDLMANGFSKSEDSDDRSP